MRIATPRGRIIIISRSSGHCLQSGPPNARRRFSCPCCSLGFALYLLCFQAHASTLRSFWQGRVSHWNQEGGVRKMRIGRLDLTCALTVRNFGSQGALHPCETGSKCLSERKIYGSHPALGRNGNFRSAGERESEADSTARRPGTAVGESRSNVSVNFLDLRPRMHNTATAFLFAWVFEVCYYRTGRDRNPPFEYPIQQRSELNH